MPSCKDRSRQHTCASCKYWHVLYLSLSVGCLFVFSVAFYFHFLGLLVMVTFLVKQKINLVCLKKIILLCRLSTWWLFHVRSTLLTGVVFCRIHGCKSLCFERWAKVVCNRQTFNVLSLQICVEADPYLTYCFPLCN